MRRTLGALLTMLVVAAACTNSAPSSRSPSGESPSASPAEKGKEKKNGKKGKDGKGQESPEPTPTTTVPEGEGGINKLDHLIFIVMENRSFDHYFGTYPGADGIPNKVCVPHPVLKGKCTQPYHDTDTFDLGGPHSKPASDTSVNKGRMNGFIAAAVNTARQRCLLRPLVKACKDRVGPQGQPELMGYHTRDEIPVYWKYADDFVLQDRMFAPTDSWTLPAHLYLVSAWSAICRNHKKPMSCRGSVGGYGEKIEVPKGSKDTPYAWTDITYLLHKFGVSWKYYVGPDGTCYGAACDKKKHQDTSTGFQNVLPGFLTVKENKQRENIVPYSDYLDDAGAGELPSVSWIMPAIGESEHPGHSNIVRGQEFVTSMVNAAMESPDWNSTAIFVVWDDWGGFYDHVKPPRIDAGGYGIRVPGLMISPYAKKGYIDSQTLTFDAYLKLIEDRFMEGQRLDPKTDGRPDPRPTVREEVDQLGDLRHEFDFDQEPRAPVIVEPPKG
ncbi:MAG: alkaline phosphatase family protein [Actinomycetota bacterium]